MFDEAIISNWALPFLKPSFYRVMKAAKPFSMVSRKRMQNLWRLMSRIERQAIPGDFVELGVARGGTAVLIAAFASRSRLPREVWLYDAFEELPQPDAYFGQVRQLLYEQSAFTDDKVHVAKGLFENTVRTYPGHPISLLHIDVSGYQFVKQCLDPLLPQVVPGGWVVLDNYGVDEGCRQAVFEAIGEEAVQKRLQRLTHTQAYFQKL